jgi:hypothetical protein
MAAELLLELHPARAMTQAMARAEFRITFFFIFISPYFPNMLSC